MLIIIVLFKKDISNAMKEYIDSYDSINNLSAARVKDLENLAFLVGDNDHPIRLRHAILNYIGANMPKGLFRFPGTQSWYLVKSLRKVLNRPEYSDHELQIVMDCELEQERLKRYEGIYKKVNELEKSNRELLEELNQLKQANEFFLIEKKVMDETLESLACENHCLQLQVGQLNEQLDYAKQSLSAEKQELVEQFETMSNKYGSRIAELISKSQSDLNRLRAQYDEALQQIDEKDRYIAKLESDIKHMRQQEEDARLEKGSSSRKYALSS